MFYRLRGLSYLLLGLILLPVSASAQAGTGSARLTPPDLTSFPRVETYLDVRDSEGKFVHGLKASDIQVLEDEQPLPVTEISEIRPGVQVAIAINPGPAFAVRNSQGVSRYDFLIEALKGWGQNRLGSSSDDWSILTTGGTELSHLSDPADWLSGVISSTIDARQATPSLDTLFRAVDIVADPLSRPGMGRAVLFITPPIEGQTSLTLQNLISRASQQGVHISVWMVTPPGAPMTPASNQLVDLSTQTGGQFATFTGEGEALDPEQTIEPLRNVYHLVYTSKITTSATHTLAVEVQTEGGKFDTPVQTFNLDIQPPDPAFVSPTLEIRRKPLGGNDPLLGGESPVEAYQPKEQKLQVLVDFPDGRVRPLVGTSLSVDGVVVAENREPPFDQFTWDLTQYTSSGSHMLQVQAEDVLGLKGTSMETAVKVMIDRPASTPWSALYRHTPALAGLTILLAGAVLLLILVWGGRIHPHVFGVPRQLRRRSDPVTQPVPVKNEPSSRRLPNWVNRLQWPQRHVAPKAYAFFTRVSETDPAATGTPIPIMADEITLGSDPHQATLVLNDPSVEALHARLIRKEDGAFRLADEGSTAGTWINYTPVSREGTRLEHGDLIHIGRLGFRFTFRKPGQVRKPLITLDESDKENSP